MIQFPGPPTSVGSTARCTSGARHCHLHHQGWNNLTSVVSLTFAGVSLAVAATDHLVVDLKYLVVAAHKLAVLLPALRGVVDLYEGVEQLGDLFAFSSGGLTPASHHGLAAREGPRPLRQTDGSDGPGGDDSVQGDDGDVMERSHSVTARPAVWFIPGHGD